MLVLIAQFFSLILCGLLVPSCSSSSKLERAAGEIEKKNPFDYSLDVVVSPGKNRTVLLCSHAFGGNSRSVIQRIRPSTSDTLVSFNYYDHDFSHATGDDRKTKMATSLELMPLLYMLKQCVVESGVDAISLYGYALGGGNIINALDLLLKEEESALEKKYSITLSDKKRIVAAIRKGKILLDVPFKSLDEIISLQGPQETLLMYKERMQQHQITNPIDTLTRLKNLDMTFLVFFDIHNSEFSNLEDSNFAKRLLDANSDGTNVVITADNGGAFAVHETLWKVYESLER